MSTVIDFKQKAEERFTSEYYEGFAKEFVDVYEAQGAHRAAIFALRTLDKSRYQDARPYITEEFISRGYTFSQGDQDE